MLNMKKLLLTCAVLFCLSVLDKCNAAVSAEIKVDALSGGAKVTCSGDLYKGPVKLEDTMIKYKDSNSGEYQCEDGDNINKVFVKFRSCDNCIELNVESIAGLVVGDLLATFVIGVSVYLLAKHTPSITAAPNKKGSDKQRLVTNEVGNDEHYQPLRPRNGSRDVYDKLRR